MAGSAKVKNDTKSEGTTGSAKLRPAVFIDRDGTLNELVYDEQHGILDSPRRAEQVHAVAGAGRFLAAVREMGFLSVVVTNQPGIAKGTLSHADLDAVNARLAELCAKDGGRWDDLVFSPFHEKGGPQARPEYVKHSDCRKPRPGMLVQAAQRHGLDLAASWMVGDGLVDVQAGKAAGCRTILLTRLKISVIEKFMDMEGAEPDFVAASLADCAEIIRTGQRPPRRKEGS